MRSRGGLFSIYLIPISDSSSRMRLVTFKAGEDYRLSYLRFSRKCLLAAQRPVACDLREFGNSAPSWLFCLQDQTAAAQQKLSWL